MKRILFFIWFFTFNISNQIYSAEKVTLQLKWDNQYQFAGFYAAKWMGYYKDAGLEVEIRSGVKKNNKIVSPVDEVVKKRADFGIGSSDILVAIDKGADLSIVSTIFQQSAARMYYVLGRTKVNSLVDLTRLRVARKKDAMVDIEFQAMLLAEGIKPSTMAQMTHLPGIDQLIKGNVDISPGYSISFPYLDKTVGIKLKSIKPSSYGINFYGDSIFARRSFADKNPQLVNRFVAASLKGWRYALENSDKIAQKISKELVRNIPVKDLLRFNRFQIKGVKELTLYPFVDLGHINPDRWLHMASVLKRAGLIKTTPDINKLVFDPEKKTNENNRKNNHILIGSLISVLILIFVVLFWVKNLRRSVASTNRKLENGIGELERSKTSHRESEARFRKMIEKSPLPMVITDENQDITLFNDKFTELFGYTLDDVSTAEQWWIIAYPDENYRKKVQQSWMDAIEEAEKNNTDIGMQVWDLTIKDRSVRKCEFYMVPLGGISLIIMKDITEEKKMGDALKESEKKFKRLFEKAPLSYQSLDESGSFTDVNETWLDILGYDRSEVIGKKFCDFLPPECKEHFYENFTNFKNAGEIRGAEYEMLKKDGDRVLTSFHGKVDRDKAGQFQRTHCVFRDITQQRFAENILKKELELNKAVADISKELLADIYQIKKVSEVTLEYVLNLTGSEHGFVSSIDKKNLDHIRHTQSDMFSNNERIINEDMSFSIGSDGKYPSLWGHALNTKRSFYTNDPENHHKFKGVPKGHKKVKNFMSVPILMGESVIGLIGVANSRYGYTEQDLFSIQRISEVYALALYRQEYESERYKMERNFRQLQKNEAIGVLASGIAHDFNNILFPIVGFAEILEEDIPKDSPLLECVNEILKGALRAKDLVQQILTFSKEVEQEVKPVNPYSIVREVMKLIKSTIPSSIEIKQKLDSNCSAIMADPTQLHQIAMNLVTNAYHSMELSGGTLSVKLKNKTITEDEGIDAGNYVLFSIGDSGVGMNEEIVSKIFDPYFTTKSKEKGTGLGLSVVNGIVENYGGEIKVTSTPGKGSLFEILFPAFEGDERKIEVGKKEIPKGKGKILLVDDELSILNVEKENLNRLGYEVDSTDKSEDALKRIISYPDEYDLVITDLTMPKLTGDNLIKEVRRNNIQIPIIISTGFSGDLTVEGVKAIGANALLSKPVFLSDLAQTIRDVIKK